MRFAVRAGKSLQMISDCQDVLAQPGPRKISTVLRRIGTVDRSRDPYTRTVVSLTARERQILAFVQSKEPPPTAREIAANFGQQDDQAAQRRSHLRRAEYVAGGAVEEGAVARATKALAHN